LTLEILTKAGVHNWQYSS